MKCQRSQDCGLSQRLSPALSLPDQGLAWTKSWSCGPAPAYEQVWFLLQRFCSSSWFPQLQHEPCRHLPNTLLLPPLAKLLLR